MYRRNLSQSVLGVPRFEQQIADEAQRLDEVVARCLSQGLVYDDTDFERSEDALPKQREVLWRNARDLGLKHVFGDAPGAHDVKQGRLGKCSFLAAVAVLAENRPDFMLGLIGAHNEEVQAFMVRLCVHGRWESILVDTYFPCHQDGGLLFTRSSVLWPLLLEKAYAKVCGGYKFIASKSIWEALLFLTGDPVDRHSRRARESDEVMFATIKSAIDAKFIVTAACRSNEDGLHDHHAYSVLACDLVGSSQAVVLLRNPWGSGSYTKAIKFPGQRPIDSGSFWMEADRFFSLFGEVAICRMNPGWMTLRYYDQFQMGVGATYRIACHSPSPCVTDVQLSGPGLCARGFLVVDEKENVKLYGAHLDSYWFENVVFYGSMRVIPFCFSHPSSFFSLSLHLSQGATTVTHDSVVNDQSSAKLFCSAVLRDAEVAMQLGGCLVYRSKGSLLCYIAMNTSDRECTVELDATNSQNLKSSRDSLVVADVVAANSQHIMMVMSPINLEKGYRFGGSIRMTTGRSQHASLPPNDGLHQRNHFA